MYVDNGISPVLYSHITICQYNCNLLRFPVSLPPSPESTADSGVSVSDQESGESEIRGRPMPGNLC